MQIKNYELIGYHLLTNAPGIPATHNTRRLSIFVITNWLINHILTPIFDFFYEIKLY